MGSVYIQITVDGILCSLQRSIDSSGAVPHANATCFKQVAPGAHVVTTMFQGYGSSGIIDGYGTMFAM
jgi:hypothetical protein